MATVNKNIVQYTVSGIIHYLAVKHIVKISYDDSTYVLTIKTTNNETITLPATTDVLLENLLIAIRNYG